MSNPQSGDLIIANRGNQQYQIDVTNMSTLQTTDLVLVNRNGVNYKMEAGDLNLQVDAPIAAGSITYLDQNASKRFTQDSFSITAGAQQAAGTVTSEVKPYVVGLFNDNAGDFHGLRFEESRNTHLTDCIYGSPNRRRWTLSCWIKPTASQSGYQNILSNFDSNNQGANIALDGSDYLRLDEYVGSWQYSVYANLKPVTNDWTHIVVAFDSSNTDQAKRVIFYINGAEQPTLSNQGYPGLNYDSYLTYSAPGYKRRIGIDTLQSGPFNGYLSNFAFIEGNNVNASVFGHTVDGIWVPKSPSDVVIPTPYTAPQPPVSPYDTRPNLDQDWSANLTASNGFVSGGAATSAFDGSTSTRAGNSISSGGGTVTLTANISVSSEVKVLTGILNTVSINGTVVGSATGTDPAYVVSSGAQSITSIVVTAPNTNGYRADLYEVTVDGRVLTNGGPADNSANYDQWDTSQVWSNGVDTSNAASGGIVNSVDNIFDGNVSTIGGIYGGPLIINFTNLSGSQLKIGYDIGGGVSDFKVYLNGSSTAAYTGSGGVQQVTLAIPGGSLTQIQSTIDVNAQGQTISYIEVDGQVLVDGVDTWNTSQPWSLGAYGNWDTANPVANGFNGETTFTRTDVNKMAGVTFSSPVGIFSSLKLTAAKDSGNGKIEIQTGPSTWLDVSAQFTNGSATLETVDLFSLGINNFYGIRFNADLANTQPRFSKIAADGNVLVDGNSFGAEGFFLPFDPATAGKIYSDNVSPTNQIYVNTAATGFNGDLNDYFSFYANQEMTLLTGESIPATTLRVFGNLSTNSSTFKVNGSVVTDDASGPAKWITLTGWTSPITSLTCEDGYNSSIWAVEIDGNIIKDHTAVGVDASGNQNHFNSSGIVLGNTSQDWSSLTTANADLDSATPIGMLFDGDLTVGVRSTTGGTCILNWPSGTIQGNVRVHTIESGGPGPLKYKDGTTQLQVNAPNLNGWNDLGSIDLTELEFAHPSANNVININGIELDGNLLLAPNAVDTVDDTPVNDYAVLTSGTNGNLTASANSINLTNVGVSGTEYYYEENGGSKVHTGGSTFSSTSGSIYNFGQLALNSNVTNNGNGTVTATATVAMPITQIVLSGSCTGIDVNFWCQYSSQWSNYNCSTAFLSFKDSNGTEIHRIPSSGTLNWRQINTQIGNGITIPVNVANMASIGHVEVGGGSNSVDLTGTNWEAKTANGTTVASGTFTTGTNINAQYISTYTNNSVPNLIVSGTTYSLLFDDTATSASSRLYVVTNTAGTVTNLVSADPGFSTVASPYTVTFPATLPSGNEPDVDLPAGTYFGSDIRVTNAEGNDTATLTQVTPT